MNLSSPDSKRRRALWWAVVRDDAGALLNGLLITALVVGVVAGVFWFYTSTSRDVAGAPVRYAEGVVTTVAYEPAGEGEARPDLAILAVDGQPLVVGGRFGAGAARTTAVPLRAGDRVRYGYRVGKSGRWYLERLELLSRRR